MGLFTSKARILVVEDSIPLSEAIDTKLSKGGFKVVMVKSYNDAVKALEKNKDIKAVWLDHYLAGKETGLDVLKYIRSKEETKNILVFLVSTISSELEQNYAELGIAQQFNKSNYQMGTIISDIQAKLEVLAK